MEIATKIVTVKRGSVALASALLITLGGVAPAFATPTTDDASRSAAASAGTAFAPAGASLNLRLDGRAAGRLLADAKESEPSTEEDKGKSGEKSGEKSGDKSAEKSDEIKLTVSKGGTAPPKPAASSGSNDTFAFVKDWPFWAAVGGVVIVGAAVFMINRNSSQEHSCPSVYNAGCFGAK